MRQTGTEKDDTRTVQPIAEGVMAVFTIYLRQRGSPESKPVGAPHDETASSG